MQTHHASLSFALLLLSACSPGPAPPPEPAKGPASVPPRQAATAATPPDAPACTDEPQPRAEDERARCGGVAATASPTSRAYHVASEGGQCVIEGDACDLGKPFKLSGCGIKDYYTFTPASALAGSFTYQGSMMGVRVSGAGDYTVDAGEQGGSLQTAASRNCAAGGGIAGCNAINIRFKLTPIAACGAGS